MGFDHTWGMPKKEMQIQEIQSWGMVDQVQDGDIYM